MSAANEEVKILTVASRSNVRAEHRSHVVVSGSYGGPLQRLQCGQVAGACRDHERCRHRQGQATALISSPVAA
jgi:hypothetical protein